MLTDVTLGVGGLLQSGVVTGHLLVSEPHSNCSADNTTTRVVNKRLLLRLDAITVASLGLGHANDVGDGVGKGSYRPASPHVKAL